MTSPASGAGSPFVFGLLLFSGASLLGGFATSQWWLLTARAVQGVGGAVIAPTALALITTNFPEGGERNRAFGVYAAMASAGSAVGLHAWPQGSPAASSQRPQSRCSPCSSLSPPSGSPARS